MKMNELEREIFAEQIRVSTKVIKDLEKDYSSEGTKEFYRHVAILKDIKHRFEIIESSQENIQKIDNILSKLYSKRVGNIKK